MLKESAIILAIIVLFCILVYLKQDTYPFSLIYAYLSPTITQIITTIQGYVQGPLETVQQIPGINYGATAGLTSAVTASVLKYFGNKAKAKLETTLQQKTDELKNHTTEITALTAEKKTLETQRDDVLTLAGQLQHGYDAKLETLQEELKTKDKRIQDLIEERNAATRVDIDKVADEVKEKLAVQ